MVQQRADNSLGRGELSVAALLARVAPIITSPPAVAVHKTLVNTGTIAVRTRTPMALPQRRVQALTPTAILRKRPQLFLIKS